MPALETLKKITEMATGLARPGKDQLGKLVRMREAQTFRFKDDGIIPNHPRWPLIIYRCAVRLDVDLAAGPGPDAVARQSAWSYETLLASPLLGYTLPTRSSKQSLSVRAARWERGPSLRGSPIGRSPVIVMDALLKGAIAPRGIVIARKARCCFKLPLG
jgi:hypothetical protein